VDRRVFVAGSIALLTGPHAAEAEQARKVWRIGVLSAGPRQGTISQQLLPKALRELGYVEGENLIIDWRFAEGDRARLPELASELVRLKVDAIVTTFNSEALAARQATTTIPIVMTGTWDPVGIGLVASLSHPGGNVTGMTTQPVEFAGKQIELLKQAVPQVSRVAVLWDPTYPGFAAGYKHAEMAARALGVVLQSHEVRQPTDIEPALARIVRDNANGLAIWPTNFMVVQMPRMLEFAAQRRLPTMFPSTTFMRTGALMAYGVNQAEQYRRIAAFIDKILKGAHPGDLPVEQPTKFELVINLKTAKALGLTIPPSLLARADQVIE